MCAVINISLLLYVPQYSLALPMHAERRELIGYDAKDIFDGRWAALAVRLQSVSFENYHVPLQAFELTFHEHQDDSHPWWTFWF